MTTVLICEDNESVRNLIREVAIGLGLHTLETGDGHEALELATTHQPDAVILDVHVHGCSGLEVLERLKTNPHLASIPVILVTGDHPAFIDRELAKCGAHKVLSKPFALAELAATLREALNQPIPGGIESALWP